MTAIPDKKMYRPVTWSIIGIIILILALVLFWNWDWFRPFVEHEASVQLDRPVTMSRFDVRLAFEPVFIADDIEVANPPEFPRGQRFGSVKRLAVRVDLWALLRGKIHLPEIVVDQPLGDLKPGPSGNPNWRFGSGSTAKKPGSLPEIGQLLVSNGVVHFLDPKLKADFTLTIETTPATQESPAKINVGIKGTYAGQPVIGHFTGGSVLSLSSTDAPYPVNLWLANGLTRIDLVGTVKQPQSFGGANLDLKLKGDDLSRLFPLIGIPLPATPPYSLNGHLDYADHRIRFRNFQGTVGNSDLSGEVDVDPGKERPLVTADLTSHRIDLADLGGFIGATPGKTNTPGQSATQKAEKAKAAESPNLLPDRPINLPKLRAIDAEVKYHGEHIVGTTAPLDDVSAVLSIKDGEISVHPLRFGIGQGRIAANIGLDATQNLVHAKTDVDFQQIDLRRLLASSSTFHGAGIIGGKAKIEATGNSMAQLLAHGDGGFQLFMSGGGNISALLVHLSGLEFGNSLLSALGLPDQTSIRCMVLDTKLDRGLLHTNTLVLDTTSDNIVGKGDVDFRNETVNYQIITTPKQFSIGSLPAPIDIDGLLKSPSILPDPATVATRGGIAAVLGIFLTPLGALIPTIQLGVGKDSDCNSLIAMARAHAKEPAAAPTKPN